MKTQLTYSLFIISLMLTSCGNENKYEFWPLSKFIINDNALTDSSEIKLIYYSSGPDIYEDFEKGIGTVTSPSHPEIPPFKVTDYYVHYVVLDLESQDTLNILVPEAIEITDADKEKIFYYTKTADLVKRIMLNYDKDKPKTDGNFNVNDYEIPKHDRVARDINFDHVADNNYNTVVGFVHRKTRQ